MNEISVLELLHHTLAHGDQAARAEVEQSLSNILVAWLHCHPSRQAARNLESEEYFVALAFERFWRAVAGGQVICETLAEVLVCLRASLHGAILETLRDSSRPSAVSCSQSDVENPSDWSEIWDRLQSFLLNQREQRLAYLLYHCGLGPREIVRFCPQEWSDVREIYHQRHTILERLLNNETYQLFSR